GDEIGCLAGGVAAGEQGLDGKAFEMKVGVLHKGFCAGVVGGLAFGGPDFRAGGLGQAGQVGDVVLVGVGEKNVFHAQSFGFDEVDGGGGVGAGVKGGGGLGLGVPDEVVVHRHVLEWGV